MKFSCQNLSHSIIKLGQLKFDLDLALRDEKTDIAKGFDCQRRIIEIIKSLKTAILISKLGPETYNFLVEKVGGDEELEDRISPLTIGGDTAEELQGKLEATDHHEYIKKPIDEYAQGMLHEMYQTEEFQRLVQNPENLQTIRLKVRELGFTSNPTTDQVYARAYELGLQLCPAEAGPYKFLADAEKPINFHLNIAMQQITSLVFGAENAMMVFCLVKNSQHFSFNRQWASPDSNLQLVLEFLFCLRKRR
ncbi:MAG: hypothetical protein NTW50_04065 [Candidatus Berkelbacteria bacterium]|nr:hypothetical protein [Candidatus Berkelbacteria bacterium]